MADRIKVKLEVIHDRNTGLSFNSYTYVKDGAFFQAMDLANQCFFGGGKICSLPYDDKKDFERAEAMREAIEMRENGELEEEA